MPSKSSPFTPSSILFRPRRRPRRKARALVEAPGTAPGSAGFITMAVYRHSRIAPTLRNIGISRANEKALALRERRTSELPALAGSIFGEVRPDFVVRSALPVKPWRGLDRTCIRSDQQGRMTMIRIRHAIAAAVLAASFVSLPALRQGFALQARRRLRRARRRYRRVHREACHRQGFLELLRQVSPRTARSASARISSTSSARRLADRASMSGATSRWSHAGLGDHQGRMGQIRGAVHRHAQQVQGSRERSRRTSRPWCCRSRRTSSKRSRDGGRSPPAPAFERMGQARVDLALRRRANRYCLMRSSPLGPPAGRVRP